MTKLSAQPAVRPLTGKERAAYDEQGYVVVPEVFSDEWKIVRPAPPQMR